MICQADEWRFLKNWLFAAQRLRSCGAALGRGKDVWG